jgi:hypothetical protein
MNSDPETNIIVTRKTGKGKKEIHILCPKAVVNYTRSTGFVYLVDKRREVVEIYSILF